MTTPGDRGRDLAATVAVLTDRLSIDRDLVGVQQPRAITRRRQRVTLVVPEPVRILVFLLYHDRHVGHGLAEGRRQRVDRLGNHLREFVERNVESGRRCRSWAGEVIMGGDLGVEDRPHLALDLQRAGEPEGLVRAWLGMGVRDSAIQRASDSRAMPCRPEAISPLNQCRWDSESSALIVRSSRRSRFCSCRMSTSSSCVAESARRRMPELMMRRADSAFAAGLAQRGAGSGRGRGPWRRGRRPRGRR